MREGLSMATQLSNKKVAILATDGFEQVELFKPKQALEEAGAKTVVIAPKSGTIQGWNHYDKGDEIAVDLTLDSANPEDYDALLLPGGTVNPDQLRVQEKAVQFVKAFFQAGKPVAAICHGPWTLVEADVVRGRTMTSWPSLKTDLKNAGANWVDEEVVVDQGLVTSRNPHDIPAFISKTIEEIAEGHHEEQRRSA
jgi:protease I